MQPPVLLQLQHLPGEPDIEIGYRLLIPVVFVGALIGRGGEAIAQLRQRTGARVKVHEPHDSESALAASIVSPLCRTVLKIDPIY